MQEPSSQEQEWIDESIAFANRNKKGIAKEITDKTIYLPEKDPVSVFMAGSPGAGKTETSIALLNYFANEHGTKILRIDADELRTRFPIYTGTNSHLVQAGVSILVEKTHDLALKQKQSFILDGTLTNFNKAKLNIERSIKKGRNVQILYVYSMPQQAWDFVQKREVVEGRKILPETFAEQYFKARDVVNRLKKHFEKAISVDLLVKNFDPDNNYYKDNIDSIDNHLPEKYDRTEINRIVGL